MKVDIFINEQLAATIGDDMRPSGVSSEYADEITALIESVDAKTPQDLLDHYHSPPYCWAQPSRS